MAGSEGSARVCRSRRPPRIMSGSAPQPLLALPPLPPPLSRRFALTAPLLPPSHGPAPCSTDPAVDTECSTYSKWPAPGWYSKGSCSCETCAPGFSRSYNGDCNAVRLRRLLATQHATSARECNPTTLASWASAVVVGAGKHAACPHLPRRDASQCTGDRSATACTGWEGSNTCRCTGCELRARCFGWLLGGSAVWAKAALTSFLPPPLQARLATDL